MLGIPLEKPLHPPISAKKKSTKTKPDFLLLTKLAKQRYRVILAPINPSDHYSPCTIFCKHSFENSSRNSRSRRCSSTATSPALESLQKQSNTTQSPRNQSKSNETSSVLLGLVLPHHYDEYTKLKENFTGLPYYFKTNITTSTLP